VKAAASPYPERLAVTARRTDSVSVEVVALIEWGSSAGRGSTPRMAARGTAICSARRSSYGTIGRAGDRSFAISARQTFTHIMPLSARIARYWPHSARVGGRPQMERLAVSRPRGSRYERAVGSRSRVENVVGWSTVRCAFGWRLTSDRVTRNVNR
jgi:hypothetical protein